MIWIAIQIVTAMVLAINLSAPEMEPLTSFHHVMLDASKMITYTKKINQCLNSLSSTISIVSKIIFQLNKNCN